MNKKLVVVVLGVLLSPLACNCGEITFDVPSDTTATVPGTGIDVGNSPLVPDDVFPSDLISKALAQELTKSLDTSGYKKEAVTSLKLTAMKLSTKDEAGGPDEGLECFHALTMFIGASEDDHAKVAFNKDGAFDGDPGPKSYEMELTDKELNPFLQKADALVVTADVEPGDRPLKDQDVKFEFVITVVVDAFKAL